jgi:hypothetical protein
LTGTSDAAVPTLDHCVDGRLQYRDTRSWTLVRELKTAEADAKAGAWPPDCSLLAVVTEDLVHLPPR